MRCMLIGLFLLAVNALFILSCVNHIQDENQEISYQPETGEIPIRLSTRVLCAHTRVINNEFEDRDAIGLYVLAQPQTLHQERYVDNMCFTCNSGQFEPQSVVYYPAGNGKCTFVCYYPYCEKGILEDDSKINLTVKTDQSVMKDYSLSDFMVAKLTDIVPSEKTVNIPLSHKLCRLDIILKPTVSEYASQMLKTNPTIIVKSMYTNAVYDFDNDVISDLEEPQDMMFNGEWSINGDNCLVGKKMIVFPQELNSSKHLLVLDIDGRRYSCPLPDNFSLVKGTVNTFTLTYNSETGISGIQPTINTWDEGSHGEGELEEDKMDGAILTSDFSFSQSYIYNLMCEEKIIAQVCNEYLLADNISAKAIVVYPMKDGVIDLEHGTVLQVTNEKGMVHGGNVSWDLTTHKLTYIPGSKAPVTQFYINPDYSVSLVKPDSPLHVSSRLDLLIDKRGDETISYPVVKIGTQYWMADNLNTTRYIDGTSIPLKKESVTTTAGYFKGNFAPYYLFYNEAAVTIGNLIPDGWKIPNNAEWNVLKNYVNDNASLIKAGEWNKSTGILAASNLTGFNGLPVGYIQDDNNDKPIYNNVKTTVTFWIAGDTENTVANTGIYLLYNNNSIVSGNNATKKAYSIRCVRK